MSIGMPLVLSGYEVKAREAVKAFWTGRLNAHQKQVMAGRQDAGQRGAVTAGKNMDGFLALAADVVRDNGLSDAGIMLTKSVITLPGFFRPTKQWDMLILKRDVLVAAMEFKSHVGPSFGNNFNNRVEEAIGSAVDLRTAYREGALGQNPPSFLGWLLLVEDSPKSRKPVRDRSPHFSMFPEFRDASYIDRYSVLCDKLVKEGLYSAAAVLTSNKEAGTVSGDYGETSELTSLKTFLSTLAAHVAAAAT